MGRRSPLCSPFLCAVGIPEPWNDNADMLDKLNDRRGKAEPTPEAVPVAR